MSTSSSQASSVVSPFTFRWHEKGNPKTCIAIGIFRPFDILFVAGLPTVPVNRIAITTMYAATHPDLETPGSVFALMDDGLVLHLENEDIEEGVYGTFDARAAQLIR